jgi:hypothetical protein
MTTEDAPQEIYLAIGLSQGLVWVDGSPEETLGNICRGGAAVQVPFAAFECWLRAIDGVELNTLRDIVAKYQDLDSFSDNLTYMIDSKLLLPWSSTVDDMERFQEIRVIPGGVSAGNTPDDPYRFVICSRQDGEPVLRLDLPAYGIWSFCDGFSSLEQVCKTTAEHLRLPLDSVRQRALTLLPALMQSGVALLDVVVPQG